LERSANLRYPGPEIRTLKRCKKGDRPDPEACHKIGNTSRTSVHASLAAIFVFLLLSHPACGQPIPPEKLATTIEALSRLSREQVDGNPKLKEVLGRVLESTRGTPQFLKLVQQFHVADQNAALLEVAINAPGDEAGIEAVKLILAAKGAPVLENSLKGTNTIAAAKTAEALGNTNDRQIVPLLLPMVTDSQRDVIVRKQAVRSLARVQEGAAELLKLAREDKLPADVKFVAGSELNAARWPEIKSEAFRTLPPPPGKNTEPLPPVSELLKMAGDPASGAKVFRRQEVGCINCHRVNADGTDFGPALSEIGTKLGKDAIYESILDPSAGISFGFEAWTVETKSGDESFGLIVSETNEELVMKDARNIPLHIKKSDISKRTMSKLSIMPVGLQQTMTTQELVDLVEYLSTLKKK
jgi:putative heme-binding domain-containing protein